MLSPRIQQLTLVWKTSINRNNNNKYYWRLEETVYHEDFRERPQADVSMKTLTKMEIIRPDQILINMKRITFFVVLPEITELNKSKAKTK